MLSVNGEVLVGMKDGVEYVLRFGNVARTQAETDGEGLNRYLFVLARLNEEKIAKPELEELPALPAGPTGPEKPEESPAKPEEKKQDGGCQDAPVSPEQEEDQAAKQAGEQNEEADEPSPQRCCR